MAVCIFQLEKMMIWRKKTDRFRLELDTLVIQIHARNENGHLARTFKAKHVGLLTHNSTKQSTAAGFDAIKMK